MLTGHEILQQIAANNIIIHPFHKEQLNPNSYNLRLGKELLLYEEIVLDSRRENRTKKLELTDAGIVLRPGRIYLATTDEWTETKNLIPCIDGRSSVGRLGIFVHATAGFGDIGFCGRWTLEIMVAQPVRIYPGDEIAQIYYYEPTGYIMERYHGKYHNQETVTESRMYKDGVAE